MNPTDQNSDILLNDSSFMFADDGTLDADFDLDQYSIPDIVSTIEESTGSIASVSCEMGLTEPRQADKQNSDKARPSTATELLEAFHQPGLRNSFPQVWNLAKTIGLLEELIQRPSIAIDEALHVNKFCMANVNEVMESEFFRKCKSCTMLICTAMDLIITLYGSAFSDDTTSSSSPRMRQSPGQTAGSKASVQFGVYQFDPQDDLRFQNQIVCYELERCMQLLQRQRDMVRKLSGDGTRTVQQMHQNWFSVLETQARELANSLKTFDTSR